MCKEKCVFLFPISSNRCGELGHDLRVRPVGAEDLSRGRAEGEGVATVTTATASSSGAPVELLVAPMRPIYR